MYLTQSKRNAVNSTIVNAEQITAIKLASHAGEVVVAIFAHDHRIQFVAPAETTVDKVMAALRFLESRSSRSTFLMYDREDFAEALREV